FDGVRAEPEFAAEARRMLEPFIEGCLDARALWLALQPQPSAATVQVLVPYAHQVGSAAELAAAEALAARRALPTVAGPVGPATRVWQVYSAGLDGTPVDDAETLRPLPVALLDRLVDAGALTKLPDDSPLWTAEVTARLRCRLDPGGADPADLRAAGFHAERARRAYLAG